MKKFCLKEGLWVDVQCGVFGKMERRILKAMENIKEFSITYLSAGIKLVTTTSVVPARMWCTHAIELSRQARGTNR